MSVQGIESLQEITNARDTLSVHGRYGDTTIGHLTPGEMVLPRPLADDPVLKRQLFEAFERHEINPYQYQVGHYENSINPLTGVPEFGFFKKIGKFLKKAAPTIGKIIGFVYGGPEGAAIGGGLGGAVKEGNLKAAAKHAAQGFVLGKVAVGVGMKPGGGIGSLWGQGSAATHIPGGAPSSVWGWSPQTSAGGGIGDFFQNVGARGASALGAGSIPGSSKAMNLFGKGGAWDSMSAMQKVGTGLLGATALGGLEGGEDTSEMPAPSGELGGYLQRGLTPATLPTQYGTEGVPVFAPQGAGTFAAGSESGVGSLDPATQAYVDSMMEDEEYSNLMFPEFQRVNVAGGGAIYDFRGGGNVMDENGRGDVDTVDAKLADGEFVLTKQSVTGIGGGDHGEGIEKLYAMMNHNENKAKQMGIGRA
jgi:hypothetical protein